MSDVTNDHESEENWSGCRGRRADYCELESFLDFHFKAERTAEKDGLPMHPLFIWGFPGIGKTEIVRQFAAKPVTWRGSKYSKGHTMHEVPIGQWEEMGDLHGMPERCVKIKKGKNEQWVSVDVHGGYLKNGWKMDHTAGTRTINAPPAWVPTEPGPSILFFDDMNRANGRIQRGTMQLWQTGSLLSWKLPPGCVIVCTGNPQDCEFMTTALDSAMMQRMRHITLDADAVQWGEWASDQGLDQRGIDFVLRYPEMMRGKERTSPRSLTDVFRAMKDIDLSTIEGKEMFNTVAHSVLDDETVGTMTTFLERDVQLVISPEDILKGEDIFGSDVGDIFGSIFDGGLADIFGSGLDGVLGGVGGLFEGGVDSFLDGLLPF